MEYLENKNDTKMKLLKAGIKLFSKYGFAGTSTRMLANEAGVNLSAISFHYVNKEQLYEACLAYILERIQDYYSDTYTKIEEAFVKNEMTKERAYELLEEMLDLQIQAAFGKRYQTTLALIYWEDNGLETARPLSEEVLMKHEQEMAKLLMVIAPISELRALLTSRHINGSIIAFGEHRKMIEAHVLTQMGEDSESLANFEKEAPEWVHADIKANCLAIVERVVNS